MSTRSVLRLPSSLALFATLPLAAACGDTDDDGDSGGGPIAIAGSYTDDFGGSHVVTSERWESSGPTVFAITEYDNVEQFAIAQNDAANAFSPSLWSRFDWTYDTANTLYYCQTVYDGADADAARNATPADIGDLMAGCNGFGWSKLTPAQ